MISGTRLLQSNIHRLYIILSYPNTSPRLSRRIAFCRDTYCTIVSITVLIARGGIHVVVALASSWQHLQALHSSSLTNQYKYSEYVSCHYACTGTCNVKTSWTVVKNVYSSKAGYLRNMRFINSHALYVPQVCSVSLN